MVSSWRASSWLCKIILLCLNWTETKGRGWFYPLSLYHSGDISQLVRQRVYKKVRLQTFRSYPLIHHSMFLYVTSMVNINLLQGLTIAKHIDQWVTLSNFSSSFQFAIWLHHLQCCKPWGSILIAAQNVASLSLWWWMTRWKMWPSLSQRVTKIKMTRVNVKTLVTSAIFKEYNIIVYCNWNKREQLRNLIYPVLLLHFSGCHYF